MRRAVALLCGLDRTVGRVGTSELSMNMIGGAEAPPFISRTLGLRGRGQALVRFGLTSRQALVWSGLTARQALVWSGLISRQALVRMGLAPGQALVGMLTTGPSGRIRHRLRL